MLYSLLAAVLILALSYPIMGYFCFTKGYNIAAQDKPKIESVKLRRKKIQEPAEINRLNSIMANIDRYDGTTVGQKEVR